MLVLLLLYAASMNGKAFGLYGEKERQYPEVLEIRGDPSVITLLS